ncbi:HD domain-containing phosphohydrolase [Permianibacter aggregans]|uniref:Putative two-component system response regulator n=1 Tax=Permianibacter aggregans TaxID=1510150 RepID=A0A4R6UPV0_9GAMM|nr:HD domain-containing phosphohydrolase [Permianibacter aggregans]QGX40256.1 response regulator [Permianibacter aggregans]TDQ47513.1 putative two-component system response regulator [Permianibacter aggregans]
MKGRILVVDDNSTNLAVLGELLERSGYEVRAANSGEMAVAIAPDVRPELVLLDVMMPGGIDGYETCQRLRRLSGYQGVPVLFLSADNAPQSKVKGFQVGGTDYVSKPFQADELLARISSQLELHRLRHQLEDEVARKTRKVQDLLSELNRTYEKSLALLARAGEFRDAETGNHTRRIGEYAYRMAELLGCDTSFCHHIRHAAPLHDIGKVAIPDRILLKEGPLDSEEWVVMRSHAEKGAAILRAYEEPLFLMAAEIAGNHHERFDGSGYPQGLAGQHIPLAARITTLVDTYDALRSRRPYKPAFEHERAIQVLTEGDGRTAPIHFDPELLAALVRHQDLFMEVFDKDHLVAEGNA